MKILIVDDHALFREGLCHILVELEESVEILEAHEFDSANKIVAENPDLDLILLDLGIPGKDGFAALSFFSEKFPALPVVIISASNKRSDIQRALDSGAMGYIPKETTSKVVLNALRLVFLGEVYVPSSFMSDTSNISSETEKLNALLTPRQLEIVTLLVQGKSNKSIANKINVTEATVKMHLTAIFKSLGVNNRTQAAMMAEKLGLGSPKI